MDTGIAVLLGVFIASSISALSMLIAERIRSKQVANMVVEKLAEDVARMIDGIKLEEQFKQIRDRMGKINQYLLDMERYLEDSVYDVKYNTKNISKTIENIYWEMQKTINKMEQMLSKKFEETMNEP